MSSYELMNDSAGTVQKMLNSYDRVPNAQMSKSRTSRVTAFRSQRLSQLFASNGAVKICIIKGFSLLTALGHLIYACNTGSLN